MSRLEAVAKGALGLFNVVEASPLSAFIPAGGLIRSIINAVETTERAAAVFGGSAATGEAKALAVKPLVMDALKASELFIGHDIADDALFEQAAQSYIDGTVALLKSLKPRASSTK
jgi:hypothetical protein